MKLTMRDRSQRPQLSVAVAEVGWEGPEAQPLKRSDSTNAFATAKPKILLRLPSFMAFLHLSEALTVMLQPFSQQEASHEWNINIRHTLCGMARVDSDTNRHVRCQPFEIHRRLTRLLGRYVISFGALAPADDGHEQRPSYGRPGGAPASSIRALLGRRRRDRGPGRRVLAGRGLLTPFRSASREPSLGQRRPMAL